MIRYSYQRCLLNIYIIGLIKEREGALGIQRDIDKLQDWAKTLQMSFNYEKCKIMHFGRTNFENEDTLD